MTEIFIPQAGTLVQMSGQVDSPISITPAIIHVRLSSEPLSPEKQAKMRQEVRGLLKRRQDSVDVARGQLRFDY
ncbi:MAG: hypothetical protein BVN29_05325 [Nitrospira sp. ST-bin5]|nr:MAG: hypothetical protein BVN29_05325 [Nitrospira sp. ST-bin5]